MRAFLAIALAGPVLATIERAAQAIEETSPVWRGEKWVRPENLHITVRFLGDIPEGEAPALHALMTEVTMQHGVHDITLSGVVARPRRRAATMLWATFSGEISATTALAESLSDRLASAGYGRPEHPFAPHATLVRARRAKAIGTDALVAAGQIIETAGSSERTMSVAGVTLFSSTLTPRGPHYDVLAVTDLVRD